MTSLKINLKRLSNNPRPLIRKHCIKVIIIFLLTLVIFLIYQNKSYPQPQLVIAVNGSKKVKILCYILIGERNLLAGQTIRDTWGSRCDRILFFAGFYNKYLPTTYIKTNEGYHNLWGKTKSALVHLSQDSYKEYDWYIKADSDTFVIVENLRKFVNNLNEDAPSWSGYKLKNIKLKNGYMSGGAGYVFNRKALLNVVQLFKDQQKNNDTDLTDPVQCNVLGQKGIEDLELGKCFLKSGAELVDSRDLEGRERFLPIPLVSLLNGKISNYHWIWRQAFNPIKIGESCCSPELISIHQLKAEEIRTIYYLLYKLKH